MRLLPSRGASAFLWIATQGLVACAGELASPDRDRDRAGETAGASIVGGEASLADQDAVVRLVVGDANDEVCTGTLIAPNAVLTARHCVARRASELPKVVCRVEGAGGIVAETTPDYPYDGDVDARSVRVTVGADLERPVAEAKGLELFTDGASVMCGHDVAVIVLDRSIAGVLPRAVRPRPATASERVTAVGWGFTNQASPTGTPTLPTTRLQRHDVEVLGVEGSVVEYRRASGDVILAGASTGELVVGESVCNGDSGGPLLDADGAIVGVTSRRVSTISVRCVDSPAVFSAPASPRHRAVIDAALARARVRATEPAR